MFVPYTIVNPLTIVRIRRSLPRAGDVLVHPGEAVEPAHVVAQTLLPADFRIVDVARELDVSIKRVSRCIQVKQGDMIAEGDVVASRGGLGGQTVRSPITGTVVGTGRGRLLLEAQPIPMRLNALIPGTVVEVLPSEGVVIETVGAHVQAVWGNGQESYGVLRVVVRAPKHPIRPKHIDASANGAILVGGSCIDDETLDHAIEMQVRGIVLGGVPEAMLPRLEQLSFPVIATEGIGDIPMCQAIFDLLRSLSGRDASISGQLRCQWGVRRPYVVVPMPSQAGNPINPEAPLGVGSRVRVLRGTYRGMSGVVSDMPKGLLLMDTGGRFPGVQVDLGGKDTALIPFQNLERLL
ncbi:MAG: hypothetical protein JXA21_05160 [Anaerolineae bacterium]|nr:hypothetical protein [Anaerolineae bacterium]